MIKEVLILFIISQVIGFVAFFAIGGYVEGSMPFDSLSIGFGFGMGCIVFLLLGFIILWNGYQAEENTRILNEFIDNRIYTQNLYSTFNCPICGHILNQHFITIGECPICGCLLGGD